MLGKFPQNKVAVDMDNLDHHSDVSKQAIIDELRRLRDEYGSITRNRFNRLRKEQSVRDDITLRGIKKLFGSWANAATAAGLPVGVAAWKGSKKAEKVEDCVGECREKLTQEYDNNGLYIESKSTQIRTLGELLTVAQVDLDVWEVDRHTVNCWGVTMKGKDDEGGVVPVQATNWQVKAWLKRKVPAFAEEAILGLIANIPKFKYPTRLPKYIYPTGLALEICLVDPHLGVRAWADEVGKDRDLPIGITEYTEACEQVLAQNEQYKPEKIFYVLGNDLLHVENYTGLTPMNQNVLDFDTRLIKIAQESLQAVIKCLYMCRSIAPVEVIWIPGNHDMHGSMYLSLAIQEHFKDDEYVTIDISPPPHKARLWGNLLVGWAHNTSFKQRMWVNQLALEFPKLWGQSRFREWHSGHKHKKTDTLITPTNTFGGVILRQLTGLTTPDKWHYDHLFTDAVPGAESFLWTRDRGIFANPTVFTSKEWKGVESVEEKK